MKPGRIATFGLGLVAVALMGCGGEDPLKGEAWVPPEGFATEKLSTDESVEALVQGNNAFALDLFAHLREEEGNIFFSPLSISTALTMSSAGARGNTAQEMAKALRLQLPPDARHEAYHDLLLHLMSRQTAKDVQCYKLNIANGLWGRQGYPFKPAFHDLLRKCYGAPYQAEDFRGNPDAARRRIDAWVNDQTRGLIPSICPPGKPNADTVLILVNAIYFKGNWSSKFDKSDTRDEEFTLANGSKVTVPMMHQKKLMNCLHYSEAGGFSVLQLPYIGARLCMLVLLPDKPDRLPAVEKWLTAEDDRRLFGEGWFPGGAQEVDVAFPRFTIRWQAPLKGALLKMGMKDAFTPGSADLLGMVKDADRQSVVPPWIDSVLHEAVIEVNEEGTEAAGVTWVDEYDGPGPPTPQSVFHADHPFLFLIRDADTNAILFIGRVANPKEGG